jgi:hypothetical protein
LNLGVLALNWISVNQRLKEFCVPCALSPVT